MDVFRGQSRRSGARVSTHSQECSEIDSGADRVIRPYVVPSIVKTWWSLPSVTTLRCASICRARAKGKHPVCVPPSARVAISKRGCEKAVIVSEGASCDMANCIVLGEHRAVEECFVVGVKRYGAERGRCGARLASHHCVCRTTVVKVHLSEGVGSVIDTFCVGVCGRPKANADPSRSERLDVVGPVRPGLGRCFKIQRGVTVRVRGAKSRRWKWYCQCGAVGPCLSTPE